MSKQPQKVDKRSKEYRDSLKKLPKIDQVKFTHKVDTSRQSILAKGLVNTEYGWKENPNKKSLSLTEQMQEQAQEIKNLWATVKVLQEQVTNIQTTVG